MLKGLITKVQTQRRMNQFRMAWRQKNSHNHTIAVREFPMDQVTVGAATYGELDIMLYDNCKTKLVIGPYCSIAKNVTFLLGGEHCYDRLLSYPVDKMVLGADNADHRDTGDTVIGADVWIGYGATVLSGVHIGQGAVIAAGTVVAKDVPPYAVFAAGRIVKYRFDEATIHQLLTMDFSKLTKEIIQAHPELFAQPVSDALLHEKPLEALQNTKR